MLDLAFADVGAELGLPEVHERRAASGERAEVQVDEVYLRGPGAMLE